ncbi:MAG: DUF4974 domain-containing protein [Flavobacteriaceae bacterium]|nr:DUF4974 domain-containing protein [Flavobacteriaceae bacterium]MCY4266462.1 DUF4974 domain-containing protein [Flavobacteriaceae bacterium]
MAELNIKRLLSRYVNNTASKHELDLLDDLLKENKAEDKIKKNLDKQWKLLIDKEPTHGHILSKDLMAQTLNKIRVAEKDKLVERIGWPLWSKIAAIFVGIIALAGLVYFQLTSEETLIIPDDKITLELEDGTIEIIEEDGTSPILGRNGNIIGNHIGNKLVYRSNEQSNDLVYNTLKVPYGKKFELILSDGTLIHLNSGTTLKYPVEFIPEKGKRQVFLQGEAFFKVAEDKFFPFVVNTDGIHVKVLGTEFNISSFSDNAMTYVVLVEGTVELHQNAELIGPSPLILSSGFKAQIDRELDTEIEVEKVNPFQYISWIDGELLFRKSSLENILKTFERHYNITIINHNEDLNDILFNASFKKEPIENILIYLDDVLGLDYRIKNNTVVIN